LLLNCQARFAQTFHCKGYQRISTFFNESFKNNVAGKPFEELKWLAQSQGSTNMGSDGSRTFVVSQKSFSDTFFDFY
jgi:hypothetical protein